MSGIASIRSVFESPGSLTDRLEEVHRLMLGSIPAVDRIACALYDPADELLRTFVNSTRRGTPISAYEFPLSQSHQLHRLAELGEVRVVDEIASSFEPSTEHSRWLLDQGYRSSFTIPIYDQGRFAGFLFFDSMGPGSFTPVVQRDLMLYCQLINMAIADELGAVRTITASARVARDFANLRDFETGAHLERMARYSRAIARKVAEKHGLSDEMVEHIHLFAPLHDVGKIGIPDRILRKRGRLSRGEHEVMKTHVQKGVDIIERVIGDFGLEHLADSRVMLNIVLCHHEYLDGSGYPNGLVGDAIPIEARVVTVADVFDALTTRRPYKTPWTPDAALRELERLAADGKLDEDCVAAVREEIDVFCDLVARYPS